MVFANLLKRVEAKDFAAALYQGGVIDQLKTKCEYILYVYQVSVVALALITEAEKKPEFEAVISNFREHALPVAKKGWNISSGTFDQDVLEAVGSLTRLIFSDPSVNPGLSLEWPRKWVAGFGANENNPMRLYTMASNWKIFYLRVCRMFDEVKII
jgi:hypothetical protein